MDEQREAHYRALIEFISTIKRPDKQIDKIGRDESLVRSKVIDSLAVIQIVLYLETRYGIEFASTGLDPERLGTLNGILGIIESHQK
jgi:acyl carrier protein